MSTDNEIVLHASNEIVLHVGTCSKFYNDDNIWFIWNGSDGVTSWLLAYSFNGTYIGELHWWYCFRREDWDVDSTN